MRIGIDARFLTHPQRGGFKTYTENLIAALSQVDQDNQYFLYLDRVPDANSKIPGKTNFTIHVVPNTIPLMGMIWREQVLLPRLVIQDKLDLIHSPCLTAPHFLNCASIVTIHDMIWYSPQKFYGKSKRPWSGRRILQDWYYRIATIYATRRASAIITISESSKNDIVKILNAPPDRISITNLAAGKIYRQIDDRRQIETIQKKYDLASQFILALGSADPRKNIETLIEAYALLPAIDRTRYPLILVWSNGFLASSTRGQVARLGLESQVRFLEGVTDEDLWMLYNAASLFVFPSLYEGFGLPPLEAMACGTPVIASDNSSIPEIVGDAALLTEAKDVRTLANRISLVLQDDELRASLVSKGRKRAEIFSWNKCALQTIDVYNKVVYGRQPVQEFI